MYRHLLACLFMSPLFCVAQAPAGYVAHYGLNNSAVDAGPNGFNGTLNATTAGPDRFNIAGAATVFAQGTSSGRLPGTLIQAMQNSFTLNFWMKTSMSAGGIGAWYAGASLIDAEVCGGVFDWGLSVINGGKIAFGVGPTDVTVVSPGNFNDGAWHFVTAIRNQGDITISLFVDGVLQQTVGNGVSGALVAPLFLGLGQNPCGQTPVYTGSLDEVIVYDRALTSTEVSSLYAFSLTTTLPLDFISFRGQLNGGVAKLDWEVANVVNNHHFEVEYSTDGLSYIVAGTMKADDAIVRYNFTVGGLQSRSYIFRIKQVDVDGRSSYSKTIALRVSGLADDLTLAGNPVASKLVLRNNSLQAITGYRIMDGTGRQLKQVQTHTSSNELGINVEELKPGYYLIQVTTEGGMQALPFIKR